MPKNLNNFSVYKDETFNTTLSNLAKGGYSEAIPITATLKTLSPHTNLTTQNLPISFPGTIYKTGNMYTLAIQITSGDITITADSTYTELELDINPVSISPAINGTPYRAFCVPDIVTGTSPIAFSTLVSYQSEFYLNSLTTSWTSGANVANTSPTINISLPFVIK